MGSHLESRCRSLPPTGAVVGSEMNLQIHIRKELWLAIQSAYEAANYNHAILDAIHFMSDVLRTRSGLDGDGQSLVGQALGGSSPRLRVNRLQTETERDVQKGIEQTLRGIYLAIRNPRSHEQIQDLQEDADAIIHFIDYLVGVLAQSEEPFTIPAFLERVFDPDFVESEQYAQLLANEIPPNKRIDTLIEIYRQKLNGDGAKIAYIVRAILKELPEDARSQFLAVVSDEFRTVREERDIRQALRLLSADLWPRLDEAARLRIEGKLIKSIREGEIWLDGSVQGGLGTWARDFLKHFTSKEEVSKVLLAKLADDDIDDRRYVTNGASLTESWGFSKLWLRDQTERRQPHDYTGFYHKFVLLGR